LVIHQGVVRRVLPRPSGRQQMRRPHADLSPREDIPASGHPRRALDDERAA
jgi:hypothetical protein